MILVCDENCGTGMPQALTLVGYKTRYFVELGWSGKKDTEILSLLGKTEWLLLSCNKKMLIVPSECNAIIQNKVGIVYLTTGQEYPAKVLALLLKKWEVLELLWDTEERPFVRFLHPNGLITEKYKDLQLPKGKEKQGRLV